MTNADKIRSMTDEELAQKMCWNIECLKCPCCKIDKLTLEPTCNGDTLGDYKHLLNWLKQESEEEK